MTRRDKTGPAIEDADKLWRLEIFGNLWKSLEIFGNLWKSLEIFGNPKISKDFQTPKFFVRVFDCGGAIAHAERSRSGPLAFWTPEHSRHVERWAGQRPLI